MYIKHDDTVTILEKRAARQTALIKLYQSPIITLTLNVPNELANKSYCQVIFHSALDALDAKLAPKNIKVLERQFSVEQNGQEGLFVIDIASSTLLKKLMIEIENEQTLGKLFNFDVMSPSGVTISRKSAFLPPRSCLICSQIAQKCSTTKKHRIQDIEDAIIELCNSKIKTS